MGAGPIQKYLSYQNQRSGGSGDQKEKTALKISGNTA